MNINKLNGLYARDKVTGYEGVVVVTSLYLNKCVQVGIKKTDLNKDGVPIEAQSFDLEQVDFLDNPPIEFVKSKVTLESVMGKKATDRVTGFKGIVTIAAVYPNGHLRLGIQSEILDGDGKPTDAQFFDMEQLLVGEDVPALVPNKKPTGGPARPKDNRIS